MNTTPNFNKIRAIAENIFIAVALVILWLLPADFFDSGQSLCLSVQLFGMECYACGMTRSLMHLLHFEWQEALYYNVLGLFVFPLLGFVVVKRFWTNTRVIRANSENN